MGAQIDIATSPGATSPDWNPMRLAAFIEQHMEPILKKWEEYAAGMFPAARHMDSPALRDHAQQILEAVAKDLATFQSREAQLQKSLGMAPVLSSETAAQTHALLRAKGGFTINQLVAEYRALRASVLREWMDAYTPAETTLDDMIRFNEAIDQAISESVGYYSKQVDQGRNLFLGTLGHDLRTPLQAIQNTAAYLSAINADEAVSTAASRLIRSGARMHALLDDLLDFSRSNLGLGINVWRTPVDLAILFREAIEQIEAVHPRHIVHLSIEGDARGSWDGSRLQQMLENLVLNAIKYGSPDDPVYVDVAGAPAEVRIEVRNSGPNIDPETLKTMFEPMKRGLHEKAKSDADTGLGLGLYIAREIVNAHKGSIEARSNREQTVFTVRLPRQEST